MMTLQEFVETSLEQIVAGVAGFNEKHKLLGASVNPRTDGSVNTEEWSKAGLIFTGFGENDDAQYATLVDFDVAVTGEETDAKSGGGGIKVVSIFRADGTMEASTKNTTVSHLKFRLALQIKSDKTQPRA